MPFNMEIPGQIDAVGLEFIERLGKRVPPGGRVLELGSLFGRSAWAWAKSIDPSATLYCVDPWQREHWIKELEDHFAVEFGIEAFHRHTADCTNIVALPGRSPADLYDWNLPLDIYFDDSVHTNPMFRQNLDFWINHVKVGGVLCGDDYGPQFPDIVAEVHALAERLGVAVEVIGSIWMIELPPTFGPEARVPLEPPLPPLVERPLELAAMPALPPDIGTMMKPEELQLLYSLAKSHYRGDGEVIDLGPFLGSSTVMLVDGMFANQAMSSRTPRVFSFDRFVYEEYKGFDSFLKLEDLPTRSFFPHFLVNLGHRQENVYCSPGDLLDFSWNQHPIEILFVDLAKTPQLNNHIIRQFFGPLMPQHSVVIQQDYFYYGCPWVIVAMEHLADWFSYVGNAIGGTAYFQSRAKVPEIVLRTPVEVALNPARRTMLLERAAARQTGSARKPILDIARAYHLADGGWHAAAQALMENIAPANLRDPWSHDLQWNFTEASREMERFRDAAA